MGSALPLDLLIDITSSGVKDDFAIGKLNTIVIEKYNELLPNSKFNQASDLQTVQSIFGAISSVAKFAEVYFGVISKSATKADNLFIYNWNETDTPAVLKGGKLSSLGELKKLNGKLKITLGGVSVDISVNFSTADSFASAANLLQTAIRGATGQDSNNNFTQAVVTYNTHTDSFIIQGGLKGEGEKIDYITAPSDGTDISNKLGLTLAEGATILNGVGGVATLAEALKEIEANNGNYYIITPNFDFSNVNQDLETFGAFINASNDRFLGVYSWSNPLLEVANSGATEAFQGFNGLFIDNKKGDYQNALICGLMSAMNLSQPSGNYNIAFNDATKYQIQAITDKAKYQAMIANKANAPCKFGILGQDDTIYMDGTILGNKTDSANVYMCNSFLKFNEQIALYNMFKSQKLIGLRDKNSLAIIKSYLDEVFNSAVSANIIATGSTLTTSEKNIVISNFSSLVKNIDEVITQIENNGFYYAISNVNTITKELYITQAYMANAPVKKIIVSNYILGA